MAAAMALRTRSRLKASRVVDGQDGLGARAADDELKARVGLERRHGARRDARKASTSPASSAATWAAGSGMKRKVARRILICAAWRHSRQAVSGERGAAAPVGQLVGAGAHGLGGSWCRRPGLGR